MTIPFNDLNRSLSMIEGDLEKAFRNTLSRSRFIKGEEVRIFEQLFSEYIGVDHCIGCGNGTDAIEISLRAFGIGEGDEVIVPVNTCVPTAEAVVNAGAKPVFADVDPVFHTLTSHTAAQKITGKTRALLPVHLYGCPADMDPIMDLARENDLIVIEDCAQAHGAEYKGRKTGSIGNAAAFSFYPTKNLGALGDAGAIVSNDSLFAGKTRMIADHGQSSRDIHVLSGKNSRLDELQAAVLNVKLTRLDHWNRQRIQLAEYYFEKLEDTGLALPRQPDFALHVYHLFVTRFNHREKIIQALRDAGVQTMIHYNYLLPDLSPFSRFCNQESFPVAENLNSTILSLPFFPGMTHDEVDYVCKVIVNAL